jgi:hypothetical protein
MANPAKVDAKLKIAEGVAGVAGAGLERCLPPTPSTMIKVMRTGIQASLSYLLKNEKFGMDKKKPVINHVLIKDTVSAERDQ